VGGEDAHAHDPIHTAFDKSSQFVMLIVDAIVVVQNDFQVFQHHQGLMCAQYTMEKKLQLVRPRTESSARWSAGSARPADRRFDR